MGVAAQIDLHLGQMDVKSAYLHSTIEEEIYLEQPEGFVKREENEQTLVCKLNKSIYGLKQAAKCHLFIIYFPHKNHKTRSFLKTVRQSFTNGTSYKSNNTTIFPMEQ